jgi:chromosome segregation ATPase
MTFSRFLMLLQAQYRITDILRNVSPPSDADGRRERGQMSEESTRRLENAMAKLAETSAQHDERLAAHEEQLAAIERTNEMLRELAADYQQLLANMQRRGTGLEESYVTVTRLLESHHDGMTELRAAQANSEQKIAALTDAQIRADERQQAALTQLSESQAHTGRRLDALIDIVRTRFNGQSESS